MLDLELQRNREYHLNYILGTNFENRMYDIYSGMSTFKRPPFFEDMLTEVTQMEAIQVLCMAKASKYNYTEEQWRIWSEGVWNQDEYAKSELLNTNDLNVYEKATEDIISYLEWNRMSIIAQGMLLRAPNRQVW